MSTDVDGVEGADLATYCGLYCGACSIKGGQVRAAAKMLQGMLEGFSYASWAPKLAEQIPATKHYPEFAAVLEWLTTRDDCPGCRAGGGDPRCAIRICTREKRLAGCWECAETDCEKLANVDQGGFGTAANRQRIREVGLEDWVAEQSARVHEGFSYVSAQGTSE